MYHIVYLTTNIVNHKIYVGVHSTYNLDDGYIGSGRLITKAIKKYGIKNFKRTILHYCLEAEHAYELEKQIVDETFVNNNNTYNLALGGVLGKGNKGIKRTQEFKDNLKLKMSKEFSETHRENISKSAKNRVERDGMPCNTKEKYKKMSERMKGKKPNNYGKPCSEERKQKLREYYKNKRESKLDSLS